MKLPSLPVVKLPIINISTDPLDLLLLALTLRMKQLARTNPQFVELIHNRHFRIEIGTEHGIARQIIIRHGKVSSEAAFGQKADFRLQFSDSEYAVKTLLKANPSVFMTGMQFGNIKMEGDFSLLVWFNQAARLVAPTIPKPMQRRINRLRQLISQRTAH